MGWHDLPLDYIAQYPEKVRQVQLSDIKQAFAKHLDMDAMVTVMVGGDDKAQQ